MKLSVRFNNIFRNFELLQSNKKMNFKELEQSYKTILEGVNLPDLPAKDKKKVALTYNNRGHCKYMQVNFDDAVEDYTKAIELDESLAVAYYNRGTIFYRMGYFQEANKDLCKAVSLDSSNEEFKMGLEACKKQYSSDSNK